MEDRRHDQTHAAGHFDALEELLGELGGEGNAERGVTVYPQRVTREPAAVAMSPSQALRYTDDPARAAAAERTASPRRVVHPDVSVASLLDATGVEETPPLPAPPSAPTPVEDSHSSGLPAAPALSGYRDAADEAPTMPIAPVSATPDPVWDEVSWDEPVWDEPVWDEVSWDDQTADLLPPEPASSEPTAAPAPVAAAPPAEDTEPEPAQETPWWVAAERANRQPWWRRLLRRRG